MSFCKTPDCDNFTEGRTDYCASCNRAMRKEEQQALKDSKKVIERSKQLQKAKQQSQIKKVGTSNSWLCSNGERVTQAQINANRSIAYEQKRKIQQTVICEGCGDTAMAFAHIIPQARCKQIGKTELIWDLRNFFPADHKCNAAIENPKGQEWKVLANIEECLAFIQENDLELYSKFVNNL